jgi:hypothetical protein
MSDSRSITDSLSNAWRWSVDQSPLLNMLRRLRAIGYPNGQAEALLEDAQLPQAVDALIRTTVRRTKLWASERAEVTRELIAHMFDAIEAGKNTDEIREQFGEPKKVARLLRRSMKRKRPLYWRTYRNLKRATGIMILLVIVGYGSLAVRFYMGKPSIKRNFLAELNAPNDRYSEDQKSWPVYEEVGIAWQLHTRETLSRQKEDANTRELALDPDEEDPYDYGYTQPGLEWLHSLNSDHPDYQEVSDLVRAFEPQLKSLREASSRPSLGFLYSDRNKSVEGEDGIWRWELVEPSKNPEEHDSLVAVLLPNLSVARKQATLLLFDNHLALKEDDAPRAVENLRAVYRIAHQCSDQGFMISDLVGIAIMNMSSEHLRKTLAKSSDRITKDQLVEIAHLHSKYTTHQYIVFRTERMFFDDILQRAYTDDGDGNGRLTDEGASFLFSHESGLIHLYDPDDDYPYLESIESLTNPLMMLAISDRKTQHDLYHERMDAGLQAISEGAPSLARLSYLETLSAQRAERFGLNKSPVDLLLPAMTNYVDRVLQYKLIEQSTSLMLAIEVYRKDHGALPSSLSELDSLYIPSIPLDPFNPGHEVVYQIDGDGYFIYCAGSDGDLDGGIMSEKLADYGAIRSLSRRFQYQIAWESDLGEDQKPVIVRDESGIPKYLDPDGPDSDWVLIDMRSKPVSPSSD